MTTRPFTIVRTSDGLVTMSSPGASDLQMETQREHCPPGHEIVEGVEVMPGWRRVGDEFVPPAPAPVTPDMVKRHAARRLSYTDWYITRAADPADGRPVPSDVLAARAAIRAASDRIEATTPIPPDFTEDAYWSEPNE